MEDHVFHSVEANALALTQGSTRRPRLKTDETKTTPESSCPRYSTRLEEFFERFSPEPCDHFRVGNAFHASELFQAEEARAITDEGRPVELADHSALLGAHARSVERRFGVFLEQCAIRLDREAVEEAVEPQRLGARFDVEEVGAFELLDAFELGIHRGSRFFAEFTLERSEGLRMTRLETPRDSGSRFARPE